VVAGKTELTKAMWNYLFGHGRRADRPIRLDVSEYASLSAAERLVAKDDGYSVHSVRRSPPKSPR
jgi:ATP-dependent Clp protease ATP-binding subunit ClpA